MLACQSVSNSQHICKWGLTLTPIIYSSRGQGVGAPAAA